MQNNNNIQSQDELDRMLDDILKSDIMVPLPDGFADRIARKAVRRMAVKQSLTEFLVYAGAILLVISTVLAIMYFLSRENLDRLSSILTSNLNVISGIALVLFFILFLDRFLLPVLFKSKQREIDHYF